MAAPTFIHSTYSAAPASVVNKEADDHRLVQPRPPLLIPIQSSGLPAYSTSALPTGSSPSVPGGLPAPLHLPFSFSAGGHTQPIIDTTSTEGINLEATSIPIQSSGPPVYGTSGGSSPSVLGGLSAPVHNLPFNFTSGGHTQPSIDTISMGGRNRDNHKYDFSSATS